MKKQIAIAAMSAMIATGAQASIFGGGDTTNNTTHNNQQYGGQGGSAQGGAGGMGGTGVGVGVGMGGAGGSGGAVVGSGNSHATGGNVLGSGNSNVRNDNLNAQGQLQGQSQGQGQDQAQSQSSRNSNRNNNANANANSNANDNRSSASNSNLNSNENNGNNSETTVTVAGDSYHSARIPVATAYAPNIAPTAVCMGSTSAGGQGMTFGVSFGTSWTDQNCMLLEQVRSVAAVLGDKETAAEMMCGVDSYREARARTGKPCGSSTPATAATQPQAERVRVASTEQYTDPIVRARLGLPPLAR